MKKLREYIGDFIKVNREAQGLSRDTVGRMSGLTGVTVKTVEAGVANYRIDTLEDLMEGLGLDYRDLALYLHAPVEPPDSLEDAKTPERFIELLIAQLDDLWSTNFAGQMDNVLFTVFAKEAQARFKATIVTNRSMSISRHNTEEIRQGVTRYLEQKRYAYLKNASLGAH